MPTIDTTPPSPPYPSETTQIEVATQTHRYVVDIAAGLLDNCGDHLRPLLQRPFAPIVSERTVADHYLRRVTESLHKAGIATEELILAPGESAKSWETLAQVVEWLVAIGCERSDHIVALGGGVVGDLVGFASAIVKRGCSYIQIPTSLLAQVDSSVGGKTAINIAAGKNMVGVFHQPAHVLIDPKVLNSLPMRDLRAGYAEIVKYGLINDRDFFAWCEANSSALLAKDRQALHKAIAHSIRTKAAIVAADERETSGARALLNLGHSFGHALEAESGYSARLLHGEAVAAGMGIAFAFSAQQGLCAPQDAIRVQTHLQSCGLPYDLASVRDFAEINASGDTLAAHMAHDKKVRDGKIALILTQGIGQAFVTTDYRLDEISKFLENESEKPCI